MKLCTISIVRIMCLILIHFFKEILTTSAHFGNLANK